MNGWPRVAAEAPSARPARAATEHRARRRGSARRAARSRRARCGRSIASVERGAAPRPSTSAVDARSRRARARPAQDTSMRERRSWSRGRRSSRSTTRAKVSTMRRHAPQRGASARAAAPSADAARGARPGSSAVQPAPDHEVPARAVPQPAEQHGDHQVAVACALAAAVAAERDVQVVAQPGRQRDVPAPPELADVAARSTGARSSASARSREPRRAERDVASSRRSRSRSAARTASSPPSSRSSAACARRSVKTRSAIGRDVSAITTFLT